MGGASHRTRRRHQRQATRGDAGPEPEARGEKVLFNFTPAASPLRASTSLYEARACASLCSPLVREDGRVAARLCKGSCELAARPSVAAVRVLSSARDPECIQRGAAVAGSVCYTPAGEHGSLWRRGRLSRAPGTHARSADTRTHARSAQRLTVEYRLNGGKRIRRRVLFAETLLHGCPSCEFIEVIQSAQTRNNRDTASPLADRANPIGSA